MALEVIGMVLRALEFQPWALGTESLPLISRALHLRLGHCLGTPVPVGIQGHLHFPQIQHSRFSIVT